MAKKNNTVRVDFTGIETRSTLPEGEFIFAVDECSIEEGDKGDYLKWKLKVSEGKHAGGVIYHNTSLAKQSLWVAKRMLESLGVADLDGEFDIDPDEFIGLSCGGVVEHESYKGKLQARLLDTFPTESGGDGSAGDANDKADAIEIPSDDEVDGMGKKELAALNDDLELGLELDGATSAQRRAVKKALVAKRQEAGSTAKGGKKVAVEEDEEPSAPEDKKSSRKAKAEEEEEEAPAKSKKKPKKVTYTEDAIEEMSAEELQEIIEKHELDVDLDNFPRLSKQRAAVINSLEEAGLIAEAE